MTDWLPTPKTKTPEAGYDLAVKPARIAASHVVAVQLATVAAANDYWRSV